MAIPTNHSDIADDQQTGSNETSAEPTNDNDISPTELALLDSAGTSEPGDDDEMLIDSQLDNLDDDGEVLNEDDDLTGDDLDVPGSEEDDPNESIGEEDEENNAFSMRDQDDIDDEPIL